MSPYKSYPIISHIGAAHIKAPALISELLFGSECGEADRKSDWFLDRMIQC